MTTRVTYVANVRIPSRKAHPYQIVQMCDAFVDVGEEVELVVPYRRLPEDAPQSADAYFDSPMAFELTRLPCIDFLWLLPRLPDVLAAPIFYLQTATFTLSALLYVAVVRSDLVYSRARLFTVLAAPFLGDSLVMEVHRRPSRDWVARLVGWALNHAGGLVVITEGLRDEWATVTDAPVVVEPDGVRLERFEVSASKSELRDLLDLPADAQIACYTGSIKPWKGVDTLVRAAALLSEEFVVCIVGGSDEQRARLRREVGDVPANIQFAGRVRPDVVPRYLAASDVLVLPNSGEQNISARYTSPLKLFEYMAAGRAIVASDLPSIREVLDEETAFFATADDPESLAAAIERASGEEGTRRAANARERVEQYTWTARAERIRATFLEQGNEVTG